MRLQPECRYCQASTVVVYMFEYVQRLRLTDDDKPSMAYFKSDVEIIVGKRWKGLVNCPPDTVYGPLFSMVIVQDRPKEFNNKKSVKKLLQKVLYLQSDDANDMEEIIDHGGVSQSRAYTATCCLANEHIAR